MDGNVGLSFGVNKTVVSTIQISVFANVLPYCSEFVAVQLALGSVEFARCKLIHHSLRINEALDFGRHVIS